MADTNFIDKTTVIQADWLNDVNRLHYTLLQDPNTVQDIKDVLGINGGGGPTIIRKTSDETKTNDDVVADDSELVVPVLANKTYSVKALIHFKPSTSFPPIECGFNGPASSTFFMTSYGSDSGGVSIVTRAFTNLIPTIIPTATSAIEHGILFEGNVVTGVSAGNFAFQWAQDTSSALSITVKANSWIELRDIT